MSKASSTPRRSSRTRSKRAAAGRTTADGTQGSAEDLGGPDRLYEFADRVNEEAAEETAERVEQKLETWVTFGLANEVFALPVTAVREILRVREITRVPHAPYTVRGIINMRGRVVPVVDLRLRLGLHDAEVTSKSRILIVSARDRYLGFLVDSVEQVARLDRNAVEPAPPDVMTEQSEYIIGVYQTDQMFWILLDVDRVLVIPDSLQPMQEHSGQAA